MTKEVTGRAFRNRLRGSTSAAVKTRWASKTPFEETSTLSLLAKLRCGALKPAAVELVRAELTRRGLGENSN
jgi:hypothetical protein